jgi:uncharacterized protein
MTGKAEAGGLMRKAVLAALGYIAIMAVGMFTAGHVFGISYGDTEIVNVLVFFELAMSVYAIIMARRIFGHWHCGFGPIDWSGMWWLVPAFLVMAALFAAAFLTGTVGVSLLVLTVIVTMCLVGFSEELMFRGIVLKGALSEVSMGKAILISSALFSSLHAVNVLAFVPLDGMVQQLILTFIFGLAMACYALRVNSLVPLIIFHALWDMVQFLGGLWGSDFGFLIPIGIVVNAIGGAALWWLVLRRGKG